LFRLGVCKQGYLVEFFVSGSTARAAAALFGVNKYTAAYFYNRLLKIIVQRLNEKTVKLLMLT
jgi:transposase